MRGIVGLAVVLAGATSARAHFGDLEELAGVVVHPLNPDVIVVRYAHKGEGLVFSRDGGATWGMQCGDAIGDDLVIAGATVIAGDGAVITGSFRGVREGSPDGCGWQRGAVFEDQAVSDLTLDQRDRQTVYAITGSGVDGAGNGMARRDADGTWTEVGERQEMLLLRVRVTTTSEGVRVYQLAQQGTLTRTIEGVEREVPNYLIRVSDDGGVTFRTHPLQVDWGSVTLEAIDPTDADRIVVNVRRYDEADTILVSEDQGATFAEYATLTEFGALTMAPDGRIWIGDVGDVNNSAVKGGIWFGASLQTSAVPLSTFPVLCLHYEPSRDALFACQRWWFGPVDQATGDFTIALNLAETPQFIACDSADLVNACETQLCAGLCGATGFGDAPVCADYQRPDCGPCRASSPNASSPECSSGTAGGGATKKSGGGCSIAPARRGALVAVWWLTGVLLRARRRLRSPAVTDHDG